jgi:hypothetical protein
MKITAIGVRFSDNDFGNTIRPWLRNVVELLMYKGLLNPEESERISGNKQEPLTKEYLDNLFKRTIGTFYFMYQYTENIDDVDGLITGNYLRNHPVHFFLNDEVCEYILENNQWDNGEFFYWDNHTGFGEI